MKIRVLVVDDEQLARRRVLRLLKGEPEVDVVDVCASGPEAVRAIQQAPPDLLFLDVQMPEVDGFQVLEQVGAQRMPLVIFVTAFDQYALRAFEVHALDYLLKPFDAERFRKAFRRALAQIERRTAREQSRRLITLLEQLNSEQEQLGQLVARSNEKYLDRLLVKAGGRVFFLRVSEIDWIEAAGNYVRLHTGKQSHLLRETMAQMQNRLDPVQFLRIHRSTIVNLDRIKEMRPWFAGDYAVILADGTELRLSRGYRERLAERVGDLF